MSNLKIVVDENIPAVDALFGDLGVISRFPGRSMSSDDLQGADILLVRSVTNVNQALLAKSQVSFVGTCTIGTDHLDKAFLHANNLPWSAAPGCNAGGVVQYALAAMATYLPDWAEKTVGIIGCGNVGGRLYGTLKALGIKVRVADPHKSTTNIPDLTTLDDVLACDIVCLHTPLIVDGPHPTLNLINADNLKRINPGALLINAGRGEVIDNRALCEHLKKTLSLKVVLDVWANEPNIYTPLMEPILCGTPHIAGYSYEGKLNGSLMVYEALAKHLGLRTGVMTERIEEVKREVLGERKPLVASSINEAILKTYDLPADNALLEGVIQSQEPMNKAFDKLRKAYWQRREFGHYYCDNGNADVDAFLRAVSGVAC